MEVMNVKQVAKYLGVHEMTVYRLAKADPKKLPMFRVGGRWRAFKKEIELLGQTGRLEALDR